MNKKRNYILLSALTTTACQYSPILARFSEQTNAITTEAMAAQIAIPRPIHQAETKQLIQAMPDTSFCLCVRSDKFKPLGLSFKDFVQVVYHQDHKGLIFYYKKTEKELLPVLQHYYAKNPIALELKTIAVEDPLDFQELISKTEPIKGGNTKTVNSPYGTGLHYLKNHIGPSNNALYQGYSALDLNRITMAYDNIPYQTGACECSVNAAARAIILAGGHITERAYHAFVGKCPTIGKTINSLSKRTAIAGLATSVAGFLLCFIPGGATIGVPMAVTGMAGSGVGSVGLALTEHHKTALRFGVDPWDLSNYINRYLTHSDTHSYVHCFDDFYAYEAAVKQDITNHEPVIAFFFFATTAWHYANIVAIKTNDEGGIVEFIVLDTIAKEQSKIFEIITHDDMEYLARNEYKTITSLALWNKPKHDYCLIRFKKK